MKEFGIRISVRCVRESQVEMKYAKDRMGHEQVEKEIGHISLR